MIAPAMNTRPQEALSYRDLARQKAQISRQIGLDELPRVRAVASTETVDGFEVTLTFSVDAGGHSQVSGELTGQVTMTCNGCAEVLAYPLRLEFGCLIAESEAIADGLVEDGRLDGAGHPAKDVLVADGLEVTVAQIVEDEILLSLPERLCVSEPCERAPELAYPAAVEQGTEASVAETAEADEDNPFSVLADLKKEQSRMPDEPGS